jgi:hypothetical protein
MLRRLATAMLPTIALCVFPAQAQVGKTQLDAQSHPALASATTATCPFAINRSTTIAFRRDLPLTVPQLIGEMADKEEPFQATDMLPPGRHLPFLRFVSAEGRGCDLMVKYEQGGIAHSWLTAHLRFDTDRWTLVNR